MHLFSTLLELARSASLAILEFGVDYGSNPAADFPSMTEMLACNAYDIPSRTKKARPTRIMRVLPKRPILLPILSRGRLSILSPMICDTRLRPFCRVGSKVMRNKGATAIVLLS